MALTNIIQVEVAYALPDRQSIIKIEVPEGTTVEEAVAQSGIVNDYPEIDLAKAKFGVFGKLAKSAAVLRAGDRVEIYRPLIADPKLARKKRATEAAEEAKAAKVAAKAKPEKAD